jgi:hypothetical protein
VPEEAGLDIDFDAELADIQAASAGLPAPAPAQVEVAGQVVTSARTVELLGRRFRIADKIGLMPLLKFSAFADMSVADPRALGAMYAMLRDVIHPGNPACGKCEACTDGRERSCPEFDPGDWRAFEDHACESKAEADDLMDVVTKAIELIAGRPTGPSSSSSPGPRSTRGGSTGRSSARRRTGSRR